MCCTIIINVSSEPETEDNIMLINRWITNRQGNSLSLCTPIMGGNK